MTAAVRPMTGADVAAAAAVQIEAFADQDRRHGEEPTPITDALRRRIDTRHRHFLTHDPAGAWVAESDGAVVGCALALRRESLWGLSLLVVDPAAQSAGLGRRLLDASLRYADGCDRAVILSSRDPRAIRAYATVGFALHPQVEANGTPDAAALPPSDPRVREGSVADVELADGVDRAVRGAARGPDQVRMASDMTMFVAERGKDRGYAYLRDDGEVSVVAATDEESARSLLWRCLAHRHEAAADAHLYHLNAGQQWAIEVAFAARLRVIPGGPVFWRGTSPPAAYLPSGAYL